MEKRKLVKPQNNEKIENRAVYTCEAPNLCPTNATCGSHCGFSCRDGTNLYSCGNGCPSGNSGTCSC